MTIPGLESLLADSLTHADSPHNGKWRTDEYFFQPDALLRGTINLSPAWFERGHTVRRIWILVLWGFYSQIQVPPACICSIEGREI